MRESDKQGDLKSDMLLLSGRCAVKNETEAFCCQQFVSLELR
jgi:hypothetical protein